MHIYLFCSIKFCGTFVKYSMNLSPCVLLCVKYLNRTIESLNFFWYLKTYKINFFCHIFGLIQSDSKTFLGFKFQSKYCPDLSTCDSENLELLFYCMQTNMFDVLNTKLICTIIKLDFLFKKGTYSLIIFEL